MGVAFDEVAFNLSKTKKGKPQILLLEVFDETSPGVWDFEWDSSQIANGKYYVQPIGPTPDEIVVTGTPVLLTTKNPVLKVAPTTQKAGKNVSLHLTNPPEHGTTPATAVGRFCAGAAPVTAADFAPDVSRERAGVGAVQEDLGGRVGAQSRPESRNPVTASRTTTALAAIPRSRSRPTAL